MWRKLLIIHLLFVLALPEYVLQMLVLQTKGLAFNTLGPSQERWIRNNNLERALVSGYES